MHAVRSDQIFLYLAQLVKDYNFQTSSPGVGQVDRESSPQLKEEKERTQNRYNRMPEKTQNEHRHNHVLLSWGRNLVLDVERSLHLVVPML